MASDNPQDEANGLRRAADDTERPPEEPRNAAAPDLNISAQSRDRWHKNPSNWIQLFTLLSVAIYTLFTYCILQNSQEQVSVSRDNEQRSLRAYVVLTDFGIFCPDCGDTLLAPNGRPDIRNSIRTRMENNGQTPASEVVGITNWWQESGKNAKLPPRFAFPDHERHGFISKSDIGRDKHKDSAEEMDADAIATFKDAATGNSTLFLYGHIDYCDIFGEPHTTAYCFIYVPNGGLNLPLCDRYNGEIAPKGKCNDTTAAR